MNSTLQQWLSDLAAWGQAIPQRLGHNQVPDVKELLSRLSHMEIYQAALLLVFGLVYLLWGARIFKFLVTVNLAIAGVILGSSLGALHSPQWSMYGALAGAVVMAILAWPLMRFAVCFMGAAAGAFAGYSLWRYFTILYRPEWLQYVWLGAAAGMILFGAMAFVLFRTVIMLFTSLQGAVLAVAGGVAVALHYEPIAKTVHDPLLRDPHLLPLLVIFTTAAGFLFQAVSLTRKKGAAAEPSPKAA